MNLEEEKPQLILHNIQADVMYWIRLRRCCKKV